MPRPRPVANGRASALPMFNNMQIYEILNLNCKKKENRKRLLEEVMEITRLSRKPTLQKLESMIVSVGKKYGFQVQYVRQMSEGIAMSVRVGDAYQMLMCQTYYEACCKLLLYIKAYKEYRKLKVK